MRKDNLTFIVKTNFNCNLECAYCYEGYAPAEGAISFQTVDNLISKVGQFAKQTNQSSSFIWHGGEPLLMGLPFYEHVVSVQKSIGGDFKNSIQTNGLLLDETIADFFVQNKFDVGISVDGPPIIHDSQRCLRTNAPTFIDVYSAMERLDNRKAKFGTIAVFTRNTLKNLIEFYEFFRDRSISVQLNPLLALGRANESGADSLKITPEEYGDALVELFDLWTKEPNLHFAIQPLEKYVRSIISGRVYSCTQEGECFNYFKVLPNGDIGMCGMLPYAKHTLGNIHRDSVLTIMESSEREDYRIIRQAKRDACRDCAYVSFCNGGCMNASLGNGGDVLSKPYYCESLKAIFKHITSVIKRYPEYWVERDLASLSYFSERNYNQSMEEK